MSFLDKHESMEDIPQEKTSMESISDDNGKLYAVIKFVQCTNEIDLIPTSWVFEEEKQTFCYYPPPDDYPQMDYFLSKLKPHKKNWETFIIEVLSYACDLKQGKKRLKRAYKSKDIDSTDVDNNNSEESVTIMSRAEIQKELKKTHPMHPQKSHTSSNNPTRALPKIPEELENSELNCLKQYIDQKIETIKNDISKQITSATRSILYDIDKKVEMLKTVMVTDHGAINRQNLTEIRKQGVNGRLPIKTIEEYLEFDELLEESENREALVNFYRVLMAGESTLEDSIGKTLEATIAKPVQLEYSGVGRSVKGKSKKNFSQTKTFGCLSDAIGEKFDIPKSLGGKVGRWLSGAPDRGGGRKQR